MSFCCFHFIVFPHRAYFVKKMLFRKFKSFRTTLAFPSRDKKISYLNVGSNFVPAFFSDNLITHKLPYSDQAEYLTVCFACVYQVIYPKL